MTKLETLRQNLLRALGEDIRLTLALGELTLEVPVDQYVNVCRTLRDDDGLRFETCIDLCGVDYSTYGNEVQETERFAVVLHLTSITHNWRLRVRTYAPDDDMPVVPSLVEIWPGVNWYEREAFDFFGILFEGHPDLRRILTDYGFIGHPFRKDFPLSGNVEMRFDPEQKRVIYQPVTIEPREIIPRVIREDGYGAGR
ncbi:MAG: NADH-quinone oxidoreductase subunit C [Pigmentiphaga sp.]|uniref:NADH-quinone oxidoreductase subunit C n=1 Tax=Pigmentiphaga sp. TaxID=1977564 RepID=UPI0029BB7C5D|nr:NADH-quinone oxidoreductase subunit C [Pigmentiphaga sp.]MDX3905007.1 NADH-quinone oxidoreductase subunit C [Pigmentiphaga sp.]